MEVELIFIHINKINNKLIYLKYNYNYFSSWK